MTLDNNLIEQISDWRRAQTNIGRKMKLLGSCHLRFQMCKHTNVSLALKNLNKIKPRTEAPIHNLIKSICSQDKDHTFLFSGLALNLGAFSSSSSSSSWELFTLLKDGVRIKRHKNGWCLVKIISLLLCGKSKPWRPSSHCCMKLWCLWLCRFGWLTLTLQDWSTELSKKIITRGVGLYS